MGRICGVPLPSFSYRHGVYLYFRGQLARLQTYRLFDSYACIGIQ